jgi:hypothetical protein
MTSPESQAPDPAWYDVISGSDLEQGDLLPRCRVPIATETAPDTEGAEFDVDVKTVDLIVLTQSCDLAHNKVSTLLLGRVYLWNAVVQAEVQRGNKAIKGKQQREQLQRGAIPNLCLLHRRTGSPALEWSVVDFHALYSLSVEAVRTHASQVGPRLRLRSPYKEHVAQAFARYFMRVGLPLDAAGFVKEAETK